MYNDYFDFPEPSTGDIVFEELKRVLLGTLKEEVKAELEALRKENEELRPYKLERDRMRADFTRAKQEYERRIKEAECKAKETAFEELFNEHLVEAWKVNRKPIYPPKCTKCDDKRQIHFKSPRGKEMTEPCECNTYTIAFEPVPALMTRFKVNPKATPANQERSGCFDKPVYYWYTTRDNIIRKDTEFQLSDFSDIGVARPAEQKPFKDCNEYWSVFTSLERCQEFCDYLAAEEEKKQKRVV